MADLYTTERVIGLIRDTLRDTVEPYLVSDDTLAASLDEIQRRFTEHTLCLTNASDYTLDVVEGTVWYDLDPRIIKVRRAYLVGAMRDVLPTTSEDVQRLTFVQDYGQAGNDWRRRVGVPELMITDLEQGKVRLTPTPQADDTMELEVYLYPAPVADVDSPLSIPDRWRTALVPGVVAELYLKQDSELYDPKAAERFMQIWEMRLREALSAIERNTRGPGNVKMSKRGVW